MQLKHGEVLPEIKAVAQGLQIVQLIAVEQLKRKYIFLDDLNSSGYLEYSKVKNIFVKQME
ncbi:MAG: hypothetical protein AB8B61_09060 [Cyclobacteriaceae bacterium]